MNRSARKLPVHVARAVRGKIIPQRIEILTAALGEAFQRPLQARQDFQIFNGWRHGGIDQRFRFQVKLARFPQEAKGETSDDSESFLGDRRPRRGNVTGMVCCTRSCFEKIRKVITGVSSMAAAWACFVLAASTRSENEGRVQLSFSSSTMARTGWPAKNMFGQYEPHFDA